VTRFNWWKQREKCATCSGRATAQGSYLLDMEALRTSSLRIISVGRAHIRPQNCNGNSQVSDAALPIRAVVDSFNLNASCRRGALRFMYTDTLLAPPAAFAAYANSVLKPETGGPELSVLTAR